MKNLINVFPRTTEKAYSQSLKNIYVFDAPAGANKQEISKAVESQFGVKVVNVKTLIQTGKAIRFSTGKRSQPGKTTHKDLKKAYVTLAKGDSIKVFEDIKAEEAKAKAEASKKEKK